MAEIMLAAFDDHDDADQAVNVLRENGYKPEDLSVMMKCPEEGQKIGRDQQVVVKKGGVVADAVEGIGAGGVVGGLAGLLLGVSAIAFPGLGLGLFVGPVAAALGLTGVAGTTVTGAVVGAATGGIIDVLVGLGVPEKEARTYVETIKSGGVLLAVPVREENESELRDILTDNNASEMRVVEANLSL